MLAAESCAECSFHTAATLRSRIGEARSLLIVSERTSVHGRFEDALRVPRQTFPRSAWLTGPYLLDLGPDGTILSCSDGISP